MTHEEKTKERHFYTSLTCLYCTYTYILWTVTGLTPVTGLPTRRHLHYPGHMQRWLLQPNVPPYCLLTMLYLCSIMDKHSTLTLTLTHPHPQTPSIYISTLLQLYM